MVVKNFRFPSVASMNISLDSAFVEKSHDAEEKNDETKGDRCHQSEQVEVSTGELQGQVQHEQISDNDSCSGSSKDHAN